MKKMLNLPKFATEVKERDFWANVDLTEYFETDDFERISFPNLKPSSRSIALRLPNYLLINLKEQANELNIPYQSLIKQYIARGILERRKRVSVKPFPTKPARATRSI